MGIALAVSLVWFCLLCATADIGTIRLPLRRHHVPYVRARGGSNDLPMSGSDQRFGEYSVDVVIGGQVFSLMLDTIAISPMRDGSGTIFGESLMQGYLVVHDRQNSRVGFHPVSEA